MPDFLGKCAPGSHPKAKGKEGGLKGGFLERAHGGRAWSVVVECVGVEWSREERSGVVVVAECSGGVWSGVECKMGSRGEC